MSMVSPAYKDVERLTTLKSLHVLYSNCYFNICIGGVGFIIDETSKEYIIHKKFIMTCKVNRDVIHPR